MVEQNCLRHVFSFLCNIAAEVANKLNVCNNQYMNTEQNINVKYKNKLPTNIHDEKYLLLNGG
jgi:hypothetical protein